MNKLTVKDLLDFKGKRQLKQVFCHYACDILGTRRNRVPRHSKTYANLHTELERLQTLRIEAFKAFSADVDAAGFPSPDKLVTVSDHEYETFLTAIEKG